MSVVVRWVLALCVTACGGGTTHIVAERREAPQVRIGSGPGGCFTPQEYEVRAAQLFADIDRNYRAALATQSLVSVELAVSRWESSGDSRSKRVMNRDGKRVLLLGVYQISCNDVGPHEFARKGSSIYTVEKRVASHWFDIPTCPETTCASVASSGGCGTAPGSTALAAELAPADDYGGHVVIDVEQWIPRQNPTGPSPCPYVEPPPPPPSPAGG